MNGYSPDLPSAIMRLLDAKREAEERKRARAMEEEDRAFQREMREFKMKEMREPKEKPSMVDYSRLAPDVFEPGTMGDPNKALDYLARIRGQDKSLEGIGLRAQMAPKKTSLTPGQEALDKAYAKSLVDYEIVDAERDKMLDQLDTAIQRLEANPKLSGALPGLLGATGRKFLMPEAAQVQEAVAEIAQKNLRQVLGGQFAEREGRELIERAYNPALPAWMNLERLNRLRKAMAQHIEIARAEKEYWDKHGTKVGFKRPELKLPSAKEFYRGLNEEDLRAGTSRPGVGGGGYGRASEGPSGGPAKGPEAAKADRKRLAEQALNDPEATPEEKAAARRILGM